MRRWLVPSAKLTAKDRRGSQTRWHRLVGWRLDIPVGRPAVDPCKGSFGLASRKFGRQEASSAKELLLVTKEELVYVAGTGRTRRDSHCVFLAQVIVWVATILAMMSIKAALLHGLVGALLVLCGCATTGVRIESSVNSFAAPEAAIHRSFYILSGMEKIGTDDLEFHEYAGAVRKVMQRQGFVPAAMIDEADLAVFLSYFIGDPESHTSTFAMPVFGQTGVASTHTYGTVNVSSPKTATYQSSTYNSPSYGVTGYMPIVRETTTYTRVLSLEGVDLSEYRNSKTVKQLWKTRVVSTGRSGDLRLIVPAMLLSAEPYLGKSSGRAVIVGIGEKDPRMLDLSPGWRSAVK